MNQCGIWWQKQENSPLDRPAAFYHCHQTLKGHFIAVRAIEPKLYAAICNTLTLIYPMFAAQMTRGNWPELRKGLPQQLKAWMLTACKWRPTQHIQACHGTSRKPLLERPATRTIVKQWCKTLLCHYFIDTPIHINISELKGWSKKTPFLIGCDHINGLKYNNIARMR